MDKTSSAELSEAINSRFNWYRNSQVCSAYLSDVKPSINDFLSSLMARVSKWFTRGCTLQELLAPQYLNFSGLSTNELGTRASMVSLVKSITGINNLFDFQKPPLLKECPRPHGGGHTIRRQGVLSNGTLRCQHAASIW